MRLTPAFICLALAVAGPIVVDGAPLPAPRATTDTADLTLGQQRNLADVNVIPSLSDPHVGADVNPCKENLLGLLGPDCQPPKSSTGDATRVAAIRVNGASNKPVKVAVVSPGHGASGEGHPRAPERNKQHHSAPHAPQHKHKPVHEAHRSGDHRGGQQHHHHHDGGRDGNSGGRGSSRGGSSPHRHTPHAHGGTKHEKSSAGASQHDTSGKMALDRSHPSVLIDLDGEELLPLKAVKTGALLGDQTPSRAALVAKHAVTQKETGVDATADKAAAAESGAKGTAHAAHSRIANGGVIDCSSHGGLTSLTALNINSCNGANGGNNAVGGSVSKSSGGVLSVLHRRQVDDGAAEEPEDGQATDAPESGEEQDGESSSPEADGAAPADETESQEPERFFWPRSSESKVLPLSLVGAVKGKATGPPHFPSLVSGLLKREIPVQEVADTAGKVSRTPKTVVGNAADAKANPPVQPHTIADKASTTRDKLPVQPHVATEKAAETREKLPVQPHTVTDKAGAAKEKLPVQPETVPQKAATIKDQLPVQPQMAAERVASAREKLPVQPQTVIDKATAVKEKLPVQPESVPQKAATVKDQLPIQPQMVTDKAGAVKEKLPVQPQSQMATAPANEVFSKLPIHTVDDKTSTVQRSLPVNPVDKARAAMDGLHSRLGHVTRRLHSDGGLFTNPPRS